MALAVDAAIYLTNIMIDKDIDNINYFKLHKLLYLAQGVMLAKYNKRLFREDIVVNSDGPKVSSYCMGEYLGGLDRIYEHYSINNIETKIDDLISTLLTSERKEILNFVADKWGYYDRDDLILLTKNDKLCVDKYKEHLSRPIVVLLDEEMKRFFETLISEEYKMSSQSSNREVLDTCIKRVEGNSYLEYKSGVKRYFDKDKIVIGPDDISGYYEGDGRNPLVKVFLAKNVKELRPFTFMNKFYLREVEIENDSELERIGSEAFVDSDKLNKFDFTKLKKLQIIEDRAFCRTNLKIVNLSECPLMYVGWAAFAGDMLLEEVIWVNFEKDMYPRPRAYIVPRSCFEDCRLLETFIGDSWDYNQRLEYIGENAFSGCERLSDVRLPEDCAVGNYNSELHLALKRRLRSKRY